MKAETIAGLRKGQSLRLALNDSEWSDAHRLIDSIESQVGLALERREVIDSQGFALICWIRGFSPPPVEMQYCSVGTGTTRGFSA